MERIYLRQEPDREVGLFLCHNADTPYVVTVNGKAVAYVDQMGDAYREYNRA